jgi:hypothetical protein
VTVEEWKALVRERGLTLWEAAIICGVSAERMRQVIGARARRLDANLPEPWMPRVRKYLETGLVDLDERVDPCRRGIVAEGLTPADALDFAARHGFWLGLRVGRPQRKRFMR